jgi:phospholipid/cholesterol/gamma-HCH transport system ATP-binding protein
MNTKTIIDVKNVTIAFGEKIILEDINLQVNEHESVVFIGPSGSGKTVLLKALAGIINPSKGHILIDGEDWQGLESEEKHDLARKVGMMFQLSALFDTLTTLQNVEFPIKEHYDYPQDKVDQIAIELLERVNLTDSLDKIPSQLSGGMQKRLAIARALALNPEVIFYDDPVAGQDPVQAEQMSNLMMELKEKNNSTLIMTTSNMRIAYKMADRIIMLVDKELIDTGSPEQTKQHPDPRVQQFIHGDLNGPISIKS